MSTIWNAKDYSQFLDMRTLPAQNLLDALPADFNPKIIYDLGCGPGNSTILLKHRWSKANITGIDSSRDMLKQARIEYPDITFIEADIATFSPHKKADCIFANASLQWLDHHEILIPSIINQLNSNGILAIQMPNNFHAPSHQVTIQILQNNPNWQHLLKKLRYGLLKTPFYNLRWYYDLLTQSELKNIRLWETEYFQEMPNHIAIFDWVKGTGLRPVLAEMDEANQKAFANAYIDAISKEYPYQANNCVLLPFKRFFMVGIKPLLIF